MAAAADGLGSDGSARAEEPLPDQSWTTGSRARAGDGAFDVVGKY